MLLKGQMVTLEKELNDYLISHYSVKIENATESQLYYSLANIAKNKLYEKKGRAFDEISGKKTVHYMSIEFLLGKTLRNNLWNLKLEDSFREILASKNKNIDKVYAFEKDAGLGNGGLGRLAACYLDSLSRLGVSAYGHSIKYEYGLFNQKIVDGKQIETPDEWLDTGSVWLEPREDKTVEVRFGGKVNQIYTEEGLIYEYEGSNIIEAIPYDMLISGYDSNVSSTLRLWQARAKNVFDIKKFDQGEFAAAMQVKNELEAINKVLYPSDATDKGRHLRLIQQYFLTSAAMQNILNDFFKTGEPVSKIPEKIAVHINDTHPVMCVPEIMRILMDEHRLGWDEAWSIVNKTVSYTNHTILSEALEVISLSSIERYVPRIAMIICEIDRRFRILLSEVYKNDARMVEEMAIIKGNKVFMANLAIYASYKVNGVSKIHSQILKTRIFRDYAEIFPNKFLNITNGITHRRWISQSNPLLDNFLLKTVGEKYYTDADVLKSLEKYKDNPKVLAELGKIKFENKQKLAAHLKETRGIDINPNARFDVQVKRIHEYKRQLMNALKIIYICEQIRANPDVPVTPQVYIFAGKAASGYLMAKRIIKLINQLSVEIENDPLLKDKIKVVFVDNYSVSLAEMLMPATEVSEQISLAGREASGTGNMKAVANGALMICTIDGANIELADHIGHQNVFEFGLTSDEVEKHFTRGYNGMEYYINSEKVRVVIDKLNSGLGGEQFNDIASYLLGHSDYKDSYMCLADFDSYIDAHYKMDSIYKDTLKWNQMSLESIANVGYFSSDRAIKEYIKKIWS